MKRFLSISHCIVRHYQIRISIHTPHTWHGMAQTACRFCRMNFLSPFFLQAKKTDTKRKEILSKRYGAVLSAPYLDGLGVETAFDAARCTHRLEQKKRKIENENEKKARAARTLWSEETDSLLGLAIVQRLSHTICDRCMRVSASLCVDVLELIRNWNFEN